MTGVWTVHSHPQETTENSCDLSHLVWTHGYQEVELLDDLTLDGPYLRVRLAMRRPATLIGRSKAGLRVEYAIEACGLGYSRVDVALPAYGVHTRLLVLSTPTQEGEVELRGAAMTERLARPQQIHPLLWLVPRGLLNRLIARHTFNGFVHDLQQDFPMWEHKRYVQPPALAAGDGLIGKYRTWARQFYANQPHTLQHRAERPCVSSGIDLPANNGAASKRREG